MTAIDLSARPEFEREPGDFSAQGMVATAMRVVNAIPWVCAAPPGLVSSCDLPLTLPRHAFEGLA